MEREKQKKLLDLFRSKLDRPMRYYMDTCTRCGLCKDACFAYASVQDVEYTPSWRAEVLRKIYKRYFTIRGRLLPSLVDGLELNDETMDLLYKAAYSCTGCRRCMMYCPFGIDTQAIQSIAKLLLIGNESEPEVLSMLADASIEKGKSVDFYKDSFIEGIKRLEKQVIAKWKGESDQIIPLDAKGANILYVALAGAHSIVPAASIFNAAKEDWTLSFFEAVNFGAFVGDPTKTQLIAKRIIDEATRLKVKEVIICECGTAFRVMKHLIGEQPFRVSHIAEVISRYIDEGRIRLEKDRVNGPITYHDPCQAARNGGIIEEPRFVLQHLTSDFREMTPNKEYNWCCGGGGGLVALDDETEDFREKTGKTKANQIKETGATIVATACENCHTQLKFLGEKHNLGVNVEFLTNLVANSLVLQQSPA
ncbi:MAG: 4Fe-4S dicluster domain-containing protein [Proteobacteria bacterium]|nr:4Fe-4S dicluster domain-containing protein [Pseudomonadota bacterium]